MTSPNMSDKSRQGADDSARYFYYMAEFIGFTAGDAEAIKQSKPYLESTSLTLSVNFTAICYATHLRENSF